MSTPAKLMYRTTNWKAYNAALTPRGSLQVWLDQDMRWHSTASAKRGRNPEVQRSSDSFCLTIEGLFNLALRQAMGMAQSLLKLVGLDWQMPNVSTVSRCQKHLAVTIEAHPRCNAPPWPQNMEEVDRLSSTQSR